MTVVPPDILEGLAVIHLAVLCASTLALPPAPAIPPAATERQQYETAKASAGTDADAHVNLALWCEAQGLNAERTKHLAIAVLRDPNHMKARGLMGLVAHGGAWLAPDRIRAKLNADEPLTEKLAQYNARRAEFDELARYERERLERSRSERNWVKERIAQRRLDQKLAPAHVKLGLWCEQAGLKAEAVAHFTAAVQLDPYHDATWKHLGYVKHHGRWLSHEQLAAEEREALAQRQADRHWEPILKRWKERLTDPHRAGEAKAQLAHLTDPRAVPAIVRVFGHMVSAEEPLAVRMLRQINDPASTKALASLAVYHSDPAVQKASIAALRGREPRDFVGSLVEMIRDPITYDLKPLLGPGSTGKLVVDSPRYHIERTYEAPPAFQLGSTFWGFVGCDANGVFVVAQGIELSHLRAIERRRAYGDEIAEIRAIEARTAELVARANFTAAVLEQRLAADLRDIEIYNASAAFSRERVIPVLEGVTGADGIQSDEDSWHVWWYDRIGYRYEPPPPVSITENLAPVSYVPYFTTCFVAGTPVQTMDGPRPIEALLVGDQVLSQSETTGALSFRPVVGIHHNEPDQTLRISLDDGAVVTSSVYHRFWRAGMGWAMARELQLGDTLRTLRGVRRVVSIMSAPSAPLFNIDVAENRTFFAGKSSLLVHDNSLPSPRLQPFDSVPPLKTAGQVTRNQ